MNLARRSIVSTIWNLLGNGITVVILFVRSILLARWLPVDTFGVYGFASAIVSLLIVAVDLGMAEAFLHRAEETQDEELAAAVHFTLKVLTTTVWVVLLVVGAFLWIDNADTRIALIVLTLTVAGSRLVQTPRLMLVRRVVHRRLALLDVVTAVVTTTVALGLAWQGVDLWALLAIDAVALGLSVVLLYIWKPVWRVRFAWSLPVVRYYFGFGSRVLGAGILSTALARIDDLWTGAFLGETALGFYSRAYRFATYPSSIIAVPVNSVISGTYAELKSDRKRLSQAFFRTNAVMVRASFFLAGLIFLVAPEFIRLVIGAKWLPMLDAFRLMIIFAMIDPIKGAVAYLFLAVGRPNQLIWTHAVQVIVLLSGLLTLGRWFGITGVAAAVDTMAIIGLGILLWQAREHVDVSLPKIFALPTIAIILSVSLTFLSLSPMNDAAQDWYTGSFKLIVFSASYACMLLLFERNDTLMLVHQIWRSLQKGTAIR